jgi:hypothetical protein
MALGEKKQTMLISMFTKISHEERKCVVAKEFDQFKAIAAAEREIQGKIVKKCASQIGGTNVFLELKDIRRFH